MTWRGKKGLLKALAERLRSRDHAVVVVAEGAGQKYVIGDTKEQDISGNIKPGDIGTYLRDTFRQYFE